MEFSMFKRHPKTQEVMALRNADTKLRECQERLADKEPFTRGKLNITAIDLGSCYVNLIDFVYLRTGGKAPTGENIQQLLERLLRNEDDAFITNLLSHIPTVVAWKETKMSLININTTEEEVKAVFDKLCLFYQWVDINYLEIDA